jgi:hypothetical protein
MNIVPFLLQRTFMGDNPMITLLQEKPMAKKMPAAKPGRPPSEEGPRTHALGIRAREEWKDWLSRFADANRSDMVDLIDDALEAYAKLKGFEAPPKR